MLSPEFFNIVSLERQRYVDFFLHETNILKKGKDTYATELQIQINDETVSYPFNVVYLDFIYKDKKNKDHIAELRLDKNLDYRRSEFCLGKMKIRLSPFCWNCCGFTADKLEVSALANWAVKWLKIDEEIPDTGLAGAIHLCSEPFLTDNKYSFTVDFGSAPVNCFTDILQLLHENNAEEVFIETSNV
jgi:hypothetical protein